MQLRDVQEVLEGRVRRGRSKNVAATSSRAVCADVHHVQERQKTRGPPCYTEARRPSARERNAHRFSCDAYIFAPVHDFVFLFHLLNYATTLLSGVVKFIGTLDENLVSPHCYVGVQLDEHGEERSRLTSLLTSSIHVPRFSPLDAQRSVQRQALLPLSSRSRRVRQLLRRRESQPTGSTTFRHRKPHVPGVLRAATQTTRAKVGSLNLLHLLHV